MIGMPGLMELLIAGIVMFVLVIAPIRFAFGRAGFRYPWLIAIPTGTSVFIAVAFAAGLTGALTPWFILPIVAIAVISMAYLSFPVERSRVWEANANFATLDDSKESESGGARTRSALSRSHHKQDSETSYRFENYRIEKKMPSLSFVVVYDCPLCGEELDSTQDEVGQTHVCPACGDEFVVPEPDPVRAAPASTPPVMTVAVKPAKSSPAVPVSKRIVNAMLGNVKRMLGNENRRLFERLAFVAVGVVIGSVVTHLVQRPDPHSRLESAQIEYGMSTDEVRGMLGQPDDIKVLYPGDSIPGLDVWSLNLPEGWKEVPADELSPEEQANAKRLQAELRKRPEEVVSVTSRKRIVWSIGPFGSYRQAGSVAEHITQFRLRIMFVEGKVVEWTKSAPLESQP